MRSKIIVVYCGFQELQELTRKYKTRQEQTIKIKSKKVKRKNPLIPENLVVELRETITLRHSGSLVEAVKLCMQDNISLLLEAGVISGGIDKIIVDSSKSIDYGFISDNIIQNAIGEGRTKHNGSKKLIQALFIGCYGKDWKDGYCQYYNKDGTLISTEIPARQVNQSESVQKQVFGNVSFDPMKFNILILPFRNPEDYSAESFVGNELRIRLIENCELREFNIDVMYLHHESFDFSHQMAQTIGRELNFTNLVIWGADSKKKDLSHQIYFHYVTSLEYWQNDFIYSFGKTEKFEVQRLIEITEGEMHLEIEDVINLVLAIKFFQEKKFEKTIENLDKIFFKKYLNDNLLMIKALCYNYLKSYKLSRRFFIKGLKLNSQNARLNNNYGVFLGGQHKNLRAKKYFKKVIDIEPNTFIGYVNYANCLDHLKDYNGANEYYQKAFSLDQNNYITLAYYARFLYSSLGKMDEAMTLLQKALKINPNSAEAHYFYARLLFDRYGWSDEVKIHYLEVLRLDPNARDGKLDKYLGLN